MKVKLIFPPNNGPSELSDHPRESNFEPRDQSIKGSAIVEMLAADWVEILQKKKKFYDVNKPRKFFFLGANSDSQKVCKDIGE